MVDFANHNCSCFCFSFFAVYVSFFWRVHISEFATALLYCSLGQDAYIVDL